MILLCRKEKSGSRILLAAAGLLQTMVFIYLTSEFIAYPKIWGGNAIAYGYSVAMFVLGALIYKVSKTRHAREGLNIDLAFKQIPPE